MYVTITPLNFAVGLLLGAWCYWLGPVALLLFLPAAWMLALRGSHRDY